MMVSPLNETNEPIHERWSLTPTYITYFGRGRLGRGRRKMHPTHSSLSSDEDWEAERICKGTNTSTE